MIRSSNIPHRGIIVVDTSALLPLCFDLPKFKGNKPGFVRFTEALIFLAANGYTVLIPEAVADECGNWMRDGSSSTDYFLKSNKFANSKKSERLEFGLVEPFMRSISDLQRRGLDIHIAPPVARDASPFAEYLTKKWEIHTGNRSNNQKTNAYIELDKEYISARTKKDRGEISTYALLSSLKDTEGPLFYLSNDTVSARAATKQTGTKVNFLNPLGLYRALSGRSLLRAANLPEIAMPVIKHYFNKQQIERLHAKPYLSLEAVDEAPLNASIRQPFDQSLFGLANQLGVPTERSFKPVQERPANRISSIERTESLKQPVSPAHKESGGRS